MVDDINSTLESLDQLNPATPSTVNTETPGGDAVSPINVPPAPTAPQPVTPIPTPAYQGGTPAGGLTSNPTQFTADLLNVNQNQQNNAAQTGQVQSESDIQNEGIYKAAAAEKNQQASDYNQLFTKHAQEGEADHQRSVEAYNKYIAAAGGLGDPKDEFWAKKDTGTKILSGLALVASGLGAGLTGQGGNPLMTVIQHQIDQNYDAHKQNIKDLYEAQRAAGAVGDSDLARQEFENKAKIQYFDLASQHVASELKAVAARSGSQLAVLAANDTVNKLQAEAAEQRKALYTTQASAGAANLATTRALQKEFRDRLEKARDSNIAQGYGAEEAQQLAIDQVGKMGFPQSITNQAKVENGYTTNAKGDFLPPAKKEPTQSDELIPETDETGRRLKPEEKEQLRQLKVKLPDGSEGLANNAQDKKDIETTMDANKVLKEYHEKVSGFLKNYESGDLTEEQIGQWKLLHQKAIAASKAAETGQPGETGRASIKLTEDALPSVPNAFWNDVGSRHFHPLYLKEAAGKLNALKSTIDQSEKDIKNKVRSPSSDAKPNEAATPDKPKLDLIPLGR